MDEMIKINVEEIMEEIRNEIREKGYTNDMLSFNDVTVNTVDTNVEEFDRVKFNEEIYSLNTLWNVQTYHAFETKSGVKAKIIVFVKRVVRKLIKFYIEPIVSEQNTFNATVVRTLNLVDRYMGENDNEAIDGKRKKEDVSIVNTLLQQNEELQKKISSLSEQQEQLRKKVEQLEK